MEINNKTLHQNTHPGLQDQHHTHLRGKFTHIYIFLFINKAYLIYGQNIQLRVSSEKPGLDILLDYIIISDLFNK